MSEDEDSEDSDEDEDASYQSDNGVKIKELDDNRTFGQFNNKRGHDEEDDQMID